MVLELEADGSIRIAERYVLRAIIDLFEVHGWIVIRTHAGLAQSIGAKRFINLGPKGRPDLVCVKPDRCVFIEAKRPRGGRMSIEQQAWREYLISRGFTHLVISDVAQAQRWMEEQ